MPLFDHFLLLLVRNPHYILHRERRLFFRCSEGRPHFGFLGERHVDALNLSTGIIAFVNQIQTDEGERNPNRFDPGSVMLSRVGVYRQLMNEIEIAQREGVVGKRMV